MTTELLIMGSGVIGLIFAVLLSIYVFSQDRGTKVMKELADKIHEGAMAFLKREYHLLLIFTCIVFVLISYFLSWGTAISFIVGAALSGLAGFLGMQIATAANVRTTNAARKSFSKALQISFSAGSVMAMCVVSFGLLGLVTLMKIYQDPNIVFGFGLGASSIALFARVGGGIYTKAADVGADLVGKVEAGIPEDDPRNPAVIADNVGDNVGDVAGMGADLFESYVGSILATMALGFLFFETTNGVFMNAGVVLPLLLAASGIVGGVIAFFLVRTDDEDHIHRAFNMGLLTSSIIVCVTGFLLVRQMFVPAGESMVHLFWPILVGLSTGILIGWNTERYTSEQKKYAQGIAHASQTGAATTIIEGIVVGMRSTKNTLLLIAVAIFLSYYLGGMSGLELNGAPVGGLYGISLAAVAMLSTLGTSLAIDAYGPIADNAGGIAEMAELNPNVRKRTDKLDAAGNTTAAIGKGFAIGSAALTALALFSTYSQAIAKETGVAAVIDITNPIVVIGLLVGGMLPFYFTSLTMASVGRAAMSMVEEVRRQFKEIPGLLKGKPGARADYARCVDISTTGSLKEMVWPGLVAIITPLVVGVAFGPEAVAGLIMGSLVSGISLAVFLSNTGGAWDNAKKYVEGGALGGKGSKQHKATVIGDTVGDPMKDTSGPALNILIKLMSIIALVCLPLFL